MNGSAEWEDDVADYDEARNLPSKDGSSRMSPHLHCGEISSGPDLALVEGQTQQRLEDLREGTDLARLCAKCDLRNSPNIQLKVTVTVTARFGGTQIAGI